MEEVALSPPAKSRTAEALELCVKHNEFICCSFDATVRVAMSLIGQANYKASKETKADAAVPDKDSRRRVVSLIGRSGALVFLKLLRGEAPETLCEAFDINLNIQVKQQVRYIGCDNPFTECVPRPIADDGQPCRPLPGPSSPSHCI